MSKRKDEKDYSPSGMAAKKLPSRFSEEAFRNKYYEEKAGLALKAKTERRKVRADFLGSMRCYPLLKLLGGYEGAGKVLYRPSADGQIAEIALCRWVDGDNPRDWSDAEKAVYFRDHTSDEWFAAWKLSSVRPAGWVNYSRWYPLTNDGLREFTRECAYLVDVEQLRCYTAVGSESEWKSADKELRRRANAQRGRENIAKARAAGKRIGRPRKAK